MRTMTISHWLLAKKKTTLTLLLCFICSIGFSNSEIVSNNLNDNYKYSKKRTINANFDAGENHALYLYGKFSNYKISTWKENQISFHVEIVTKSDKEENADKLLRQIDIVFSSSQTNNSVTAKTVLPNKIKNTGFQIDYYIMIPENIFIEIENSYGDINIDKLNKYFNMELDFGYFSIDSLFAGSKLDLSYGSAKIKYADEIDGKIDFSDIRINSGNKIDVILKYGNGNFGTIKSLTAHCEFSDVTCSNIESGYLNVKYTDTYLKNIGDITIDGSFSEVEIEHLIKKIKCTSNYGDIEINRVDADFEHIDISSQFSDVDIILSKSHKFSYNLSASFGDIENKTLKDNARRYIKEDNKIKITGNHNDDTDTHQINVDVYYGDIDIEF